MRDTITVGNQVFVADGGEVFGAVRQVAPHGGVGDLRRECGGLRRAARGRRGCPLAEGHRELQEARAALREAIATRTTRRNPAPDPRRSHDEARTLFLDRTG